MPRDSPGNPARGPSHRIIAPGDYFGSLQSIVTSSAQNDSGLFEANLRDERYLPFENSGVISEWQLELPANPSKKEPAQFDCDTISDVILHIRYTARNGGELLRKEAMAQIKQFIVDGQAAGSVRLFSVRHEFPAEWTKFKTLVPPPGDRYELKLTLRPEHSPFWAQDWLNCVSRIDLLVRSSQSNLTVINDAINGESVQLEKNDLRLGDLLKGEFPMSDSQKPAGEFKLSFDSAELDDLWIAVSWAGKENG